MSVILRAVEPADAQTYKQARLHALQTEPTAFVSAYETAAKLPDNHFVERATFKSDSFLFGAFNEAGTMIGMAGGYIDPERKRQHIAYVVSVWVHDDYRRQGLARRLTENVIDQLRNTAGITQLELSVSAHNTGAKILYESLGFTQWGMEPRSVKIGDEYYDEIHMAMRTG